MKPGNVIDLLMREPQDADVLAAYWSNTTLRDICPQGMNVPEFIEHVQGRIDWSVIDDQLKAIAAECADDNAFFGSES